jgi:simple sugar transport system ATP-binding protein
VSLPTDQKPTPLLQARGVVKRFGHVHALQGADLSVHAGEVVGLVGDNGAGKSTLVKVLSGVYQPDAGSVLLEGRPVAFSSPIAAQAAGIEVVYQDLALANDLDPAANLFLGRELTRRGLLGRLGILDKRAMTSEARRQFTRLAVNISADDRPVAAMSGGQRQGVAVARAMIWASKVVFMDEPTAALGVVQTQNVLTLVDRARSAGLTVVLISHSLPEVLQVADRIEVLRLGRRVAQFRAAETSLDEIVVAMTAGALGAADEADGRPS